MKRSELTLMTLQLPVDFLMLLFAAISAYYLRLTDWAVGLKPILFDLTFAEFFEISIWAALVWLVIFALVGLYSTDSNRKFSGEIVRVVFGCTVGLAAIALFILFTQQLFDSRFLIIFSWAFAIVYVIVGRLFVRGLKGLLYRFGMGLRRIVIVGSDDVAEELAKILEKRRELGYKVIGVFSSFTYVAAKKILSLDADELILTNARDSHKEAIKAIDFCHEHHLVFKYSADLFSSYASHRSVHPLAGIPVVELKRTKLDGWGRIIKRLFDLVLSFTLIVLTLPITILSALIILFETGGPIIYKNERVGFGGKKFITYKFRSMHKRYCTGPQFGKLGEKALKEEEKLIKKRNTRQGPIYKVGKDPRVTKFGRFLRRFSIDELPQFFNVFVGNMSIVGPRPHQPREVEGYVKEHKKVFSVKPGITGLAQISGRSDLPYEEEVRLDVFYIENWSLLLDVIVFIKTPFVLLKRRKAL